MLALLRTLKTILFSPDKLVDFSVSNGDKILSENYLQHADHFTRILNEKDNFRREKFSEAKIDVSNFRLKKSYVKKFGDNLLEIYKNKKI